MTNVLIGFLIAMAALLAAKFWLEKLSPSPAPEEKDREKPKLLKLVISLTGAFSIIYVLNFAPYIVAVFTAICSAAFCSYLSAKVYFEYGVREQRLEIQACIFALWVIQFAGFTFGFIEFVNARANVT